MTVLLAVAPLLAAVLAILIYQKELSRPIDVPRAGIDQADLLRVPRGATLAAVAGELRRLGWIRSPLVVRLEARRQGWDRRVHAGWYRWRPGETLRTLLRRLSGGEVEETRFTLREGWRLTRILPALADSAWVDPAALAALAGDPGWLADRQVPGPGLEGYLFPETYRIARGAEPPDLFDQLLRPGREFWIDSLEATASVQGLDRREVWTLASIIEAEAAADHERPLIAAVFRNRLRLGMRLESDPTVLYALGRPPGRVLYVDLDVDSPYNTYRNQGLPPGPICSPGRASLRAALAPDPRCDALFFVARGDGTHVFSRSLAEHNRARRVLRGRR